MKLQELIDRLNGIKKEVGGEALVFCGEIQSGQRVLATKVEILSPSELAHYSWRVAAHFTTWKHDPADTTDETGGVKIDYTGVEIQ